MKHKEEIAIIDFGSQFTQLISRKIREQNVFSKIYSHNISVEKLKEINPSGIIFSGGPNSVYDKNSPKISKTIFDINIPILGICYGLQLIAKLFNGKITSSKNREYGKTELTLISDSLLFNNVKKISTVWMSHADEIINLPIEFKITATSVNCEISAFENNSRNIYAVQFHPEVFHTEEGGKIFNNFLFEICKCKGNWTPKNFVEQKISEIKNEVGKNKVICALSGGVDSTVSAVLVQRAIKKNLYCVHIDTGLMRKNESIDIKKKFTKELKLNVEYINASNLFLKRLKNIINPEEKRKIIGKTFIECFDRFSKRISNAKYLVQGTLYPDVIESSSFSGSSVTIKTHHNVGGLPSKMKFKLIEPFRDLFKDEVRKIGKELNIPDWILNRHPFPGPGLAVRIIGEVTKAKLNLLRDTDEIFIDSLIKNNLYEKIWQAFAVLLPVQTVGVMGDARTYENVIAIRAVTSVDGMTADWFKFENSFLAELSNNICNKVKGINRVVYDISSKPPSTIEWE